MKKAIYTVCAVLALGLASCGGVDGNIEKYENLAKENKELKGNKEISLKEEQVKILQNEAEMYKIASKLVKEDLTDAQVERLNKVEGRVVYFTKPEKN